MTFSARFIANIIDFSVKQGADLDSLVKLTNHSFSELCDENLRLSDEVYDAVLNEALSQTNDCNLGLHIGESLNLSAAGMIVQLAQLSETIGQALQMICEFASLGCQALPVELSEIDSGYKLTMNPSSVWLQNSPESVRHTVDGAMAFTIREYHTLTRNQKYPKEIHLMHSVQDESEYKRILGDKVKFNQKENALYFSSIQVKEKVVTSDFQLLSILVNHANEKLAELENNQKFSKVVRQSIINMVKPEFPSVEQVSSNLNMSVRSLQRKLKEEGLTFSKVIDDLKKSFAESYLKNKSITIAEIAYLLGYSDPSAFNRAFKKWHGETPDLYRSKR